MVEVSTSLLSVEKEKVIKVIYNLETAKTDYFHIDVMDGEFVQNNTSAKMLEYCNYLNTITNIPLDVHLMVKEVKKYIDLFLPYNPSFITIHYESAQNVEELLDLIKYIQSNNCKAGISIKPNTDVSEIFSLLDKINLILVMTVEPGCGGQQLIGESINKIKLLYEYIKNNTLEVIIEADGGINLGNVNLIKQAGCEIIVSGTGIINSGDYKKTIAEMKV